MVSSWSKVSSIKDRPFMYIYQFERHTFKLKGFYKRKERKMAFFKHAIMIGGTGMLSEMSKWVMQQATYTVIIGRNEQRLRRLQSDYGSVHVKQLDYKDTHALRQMIQTAIVQHGAIDLVVAWIHSDAPYAISTIIHEICHLQRKKWRFFHIKGSSQHL